jgi:hypothetical protein
VRSPLRHPPYRRRSRRRRGKAPYRGRGLQRAAILTWLLTSVIVYLGRLSLREEFDETAAMFG